MRAGSGGRRVTVTQVPCTSRISFSVIEIRKGIKTV